MAKKVTRTDKVFRVLMPGENGTDVVVDCATSEQALSYVGLGGEYQGQITVLREMSIEDWLSNSRVVVKKEDK